MNLGQTMLSAATLVVLAVLVLNANRLIVQGEEDIVKGETFDIAVNYAQALLTEVSRKKFDAASKDSGYQAASEFTSPYSLGPNSAELSQVNPWPDVAPFRSMFAYDDADDYHGYQRTIDTDVVKGLKLWVEVYYVSNTSPNTKTYSKTYFKRINVYAQHSSYLNTISFSSLITN